MALHIPAMTIHRRQPFLSQQQFDRYREHANTEESFWAAHTFEADSPEQEASLRARHFVQAALNRIFLFYTAGVEPEFIGDCLEDLVRRYEICQRDMAIFEECETISPLALCHYPDQFEECVQVISLCILLQRTDLLPRFAALFDAAGYRGSDTLYEDLLGHFLPDREDVDEWYHHLYSPLIHAMYADTTNEADSLLQEHCENWYSHFTHAGWKDIHLNGEDGGYVGYWAFEAGAVAYLYGMDDSAIDHMVYPRDMVEYARREAPRPVRKLPTTEAPASLPSQQRAPLPWRRTQICLAIIGTLWRALKGRLIRAA